MKTTVLIFIFVIAVAVTAQTLTQPQPIDWRYRIQWDDPNPVGQAVAWTVYASNNTAVRMTQTKALSVDLQPLLNGAPAGTYALFTVATSALGDMGDPGTNHFVSWPGGNGKIKGGKNLQTIR